MARVSAWGVVMTGFDVGKAEITAADIRNPSLFDTATVCVIDSCMQVVSYSLRVIYLYIKTCSHDAHLSVKYY